MFLVSRADPKDPNLSRKLSGLLQSGADVNLEEILDRTTREAKHFSYHPLMLPYHLYIDHYDNTSKQFDSVLKKVEFVEESLMHVLQGEKKLHSQVSSNADGDDGQDTDHWGLARLSKSLHEASMEIAEVTRRRRFEDDFSKALQKELNLKRPAQSQMLWLLKNRYDRWARAHQLDIEGMPGRIDSLKNLVRHLWTTWMNWLLGRVLH